MPFDWTLIVERNRAELLRLLALLTALVSGELTRSKYLTALALLRPLESAVRRLIVIVARGVTAKPRAVPAPGHLRAQTKTRGERRTCFPLFDPRKYFSEFRRVKSGPHIRFFDERKAALTPVEFDPAPLLRRVDRLSRALGRLPEEAKRLARWRLRAAYRIKRPMRPGRPPGFSSRKKKDDVQVVLSNLQTMALYALEPEFA